MTNHPLTAKELDAHRLHERGMSQRAIALALDISRSTVRTRLENAHRKLELAQRDQTAT